MRQYCSVCKAHYDMSVVSESAEDGVVWLKCPNCQGILPHMPEESTDEAGADAPASEADPLAELDVENALPYDPRSEYQVDDVIHHRGWNDFGLVVDKQELAGRRRVILVRFVESGEVQLIERAEG